jgi:hypothetical protein
MYDSFNTELIYMFTTYIAPSATDFEDTFAPVAPPPDETWKNILLDCVAVAVGMAFPPFFSECECFMSGSLGLIHALTL